MSALGLESIEHTVQLTHKWINDLDAALGWDDKHRSFRLLRTVLQALRDWLSANAAAGFGGQFRVTELDDFGCLDPASVDARYASPRHPTRCFSISPTGSLVRSLSISATIRLFTSA